ncbi:PAS domain-containing protein [bacterium]|nr:PAS domain-containing protein [bacterium]
MNRLISTHRLIHKKRLYIPAITIVALSLTLTFVVAISLYRNIHRERLHLRELLENEGIALINAFSALICSKCISCESLEEQFQQLLKGVANNPEIAYIAFFSSSGEVIASSGLNDFVIETDSLPQAGETLANLKEEKHVFELIKEFPTDESYTFQSPKIFILLGLKTMAIETAHAGDLKHTIFMAVMLLLIGSASLYFIVVVQNYYLVDRTLEQMRSYTHHIVSSMPNGLISLDDSGYITTFNSAAAEILSLLPAIVKGQHFSKIFQTNVKEIESVLQNGTAIIEREIRYTQQSPSLSGQAGEIIPLSLSATQLLDDASKPLGAVILLRDLREVKQLQARAQRAEHLASIGRLASVIAHEIRNPLSSLRGFTQYFTSQFRDGTDERKYARVMISEIDRLNRVIEELLDYSRPLTLQRRETSVETILNHTIQLIQSDADGQGIRIIREFSDNLPSIWVDSEKITQALLNVCLNAVAAMESGGTLTITTRIVKQNDNVEITIADTGSGISEDDLPKVFDPFFTTKTSGTGLGLALVRKIIDHHEGTISIQSQLGKGTTVTIGLPIQA